MRNSKITSADRITIVTGSASSLEAGIKRHAAIDEERRALYVIRLVASQPNSDAPDFLRLADAFVGNQFEQLVVMLRSVPRLHVDRSADRARRDRIHADAERCDFLRDAFHHQ